MIFHHIVRILLVTFVAVSMSRQEDCDIWTYENWDPGPNRKNGNYTTNEPRCFSCGDGGFGHLILNAIRWLIAGMIEMRWIVGQKISDPRIVLVCQRITFVLKSLIAAQKFVCLIGDGQVGYALTFTIQDPSA